MLRHADKSMITNPRFLRLAVDLARELDIPVQRAVRSGGGTNAGAIHLQEQGIPVVVISLPVRYIHTHCGYAAETDVEAAVRLGCALLERLSEEIIRDF